MTGTEYPPAGQRHVVVDTSAWIECFVDSDIGRHIKPQLPSAPHCIVPTIVQHELEKWALRALDPDRQDHFDRLLEDCPVDELDTATAKAAAQINVQHKLASADALIYATARKFGADVITCDAHFKDLPFVRFFPKGSQAVLMNSFGKPHGRWERWPTAQQFGQAN